MPFKKLHSDIQEKLRISRHTKPQRRFRAAVFPLLKVVSMFIARLLKTVVKQLTCIDYLTKVKM